MFSKRNRARLALVIWVLLCATACNLPLNENAPEATGPNTGLGGDTQCLGDVVPVFEKFFVGDAKPGQLIAAWDCVGSTISTFEKYTHGRFEDRFTDKELSNFVERYF